MGKRNKKQRKQQHKNVPVDVAKHMKKLEHAVTSDIESGTREHIQMQKMLDVLSGQNYDEDITCALATISGFVLVEPGMKIFVALNGISQVTPFLIHTNADVREKAIGTLQNFLLTGGEDTVELLVNNSVVVNLMFLFKQAHQVLNGGATNNVLTDAQLLKESLFLKEALDMFTSICEPSTSVVESLDLATLLPFLLDIIKTNSFITPLRLNAAHCLYTISEENNVLTDVAIKHPDMFKGLLHLVNKSEHNLLLAILSAGVLYNLSTALHMDQEIIIKLISLCLDHDVQVLEESSTIQVEEVLQLLKAQKIALELLSNILCENGDDEAWEELDGEMDVGCDEVQEVEQNEVNNTKLLQMLQERNLANKVVSRCNGYNHTNMTNESIKHSLSKVHNRSWQCLSNLLSVTSVGLIGGIENINQLWLMLNKTLLSDNGDLQKNDNEFLDAIASAMRSIMEKMVECKQDHVCSVQSVSIVHKLLSEDIADSAKMNLISILGIIGNHVCSRDDSNEVLQKIGHLFTEMLNTKLNLVVVAEILDATFDTFADGPYVDIVLQNTNLFLVLKDLSIKLKSQIKLERKSLGENVGIGDMARINLNRFLKYKEK